VAIKKNNNLAHDEAKQVADALDADILLINSNHSCPKTDLN
jgi:hypothetical protein